MKRMAKGLAKCVQNEVFLKLIPRFLFIYCLKLNFSVTGVKKSSSLDRGFRYRRSTVIYIFTYIVS